MIKEDVDVKGKLNKFLQENRECSFGAYLLRLATKKGCNSKNIQKKSGLDRRLLSKMNKKGYHPSRRIVLTLCVVLKLTYIESRELMNFAGYDFLWNDDMDLIVIFFLNEGIYDFTVINDELYSRGFEILGSIVKEDKKRKKS